MPAHSIETISNPPDSDYKLDAKTFSYATMTDPFARRLLIRTIEKLSGQLKIWKLYRDYQYESQHSDAHGDGSSDESFWKAACRKLDITLEYSRDQLDKIPKEGPLLVVANHPYGVLDGLILCHIMHKVRPDFKVLTNSVLTRSPEVKDNLLPVDFSGTQDALQTNLYTRKEARNTLKNGGAIAVFPAGGVSTIESFSDKMAMDAAWQPFIGQLIRQNKPAVVPIFFEGQNSRLFQLASLISATLRLSLFFKELSDQIGSKISFKIGDPMAYEDLSYTDDVTAMMEFLRQHTYALGGHDI